MDESHPFVKWWTEKSRWHVPGEDWKASLACSEGNLAMEAWNAALLEVMLARGSVNAILDHLSIPERV